MSKQDKAKLVVSFNSYGGYVLEADKALAVMEMLRGAERYRIKYNNGGGTTHHIWPHQADESIVEFKYLTDAQYALAKVAGKPED